LTKQILLGLGLVFVLLIVVAIAAGPTTKAAPAASSPPVATKAFNTGNKANDMLLARTEAEQASALASVAEEGCKGTRAFYEGIVPKDGGALWDAGCDNGASY
jgi:hypothetical protein